MQVAEVPLLVLCGAPGTGKSSVAWEIYWLVAALWRVYSDTGASALVVSTAKTAERCARLRRSSHGRGAAQADSHASEHALWVERGSSYEPALAP
jgi:predicted kinase